MTATKLSSDWATVIDAWAAYLRAADRPTGTIYLRTYHLRRLATETGLGPWDVTADALAAWAGGHDWSRETRRSVRSSVRAFYGWAVSSGRTTQDPSHGLGTVKPSEPAPRPTPDNEYQRALAEASGRERLMLRLAAELGLRRAEVAQVHARDLEHDLLGWTLRVRGKGDKVRQVPMPTGLAIEVRETCAGGWAFPSERGGHLTPGHVGRLVSRLLPTGTTMHSLRHRFATRAYAVDRDLLTVQALLGHSSPETTRRYVKLPDTALRRTVLAAA